MIDPLLAQDVAEIAARRAGEIIRHAWSQPRNIQKKGDANLVTDIDLRSEALLRTLLQRHTPGIPILAEEHGITGDTEADTWWYVDPVDGTTNLAHRFPNVAVSIACLSGGEPIAGVVYNPIQDHLFRAARGHGAFLHGAPIHVSAIPTLSDALLATGFPPGYHQDASRNNIAAFTAFSARAGAMRRAGSAALDMAAVAAGWFDGFWEAHLSPWDTAAGWLLVREAGGRVSRFDGDPFDPHHPEVLASNGHLHEAMIAILEEVRGA